ncbi:hypothetical protein FB451DRAFT_676498 [Mycena latifolia]|nr:hypothetical protein FB451DRAFT_676498 [Mycena latifolia]
MSPTRMSPTRMNRSPTRMSPSLEERDEGEGSADNRQEDGEEAEDDTPSRRRTRTPHIVASASPFSSPGKDAASSPFSSKHETGGSSPFGPRHGHSPRWRNGRVQGMVRSFESSGSEGEGSPERERPSSGFFRHGYAQGQGSGFLGRYRAGSASEDEQEQDAHGGTLRPLPARPDGVDGGDGGVDLGATVRGAPSSGYAHPNGGPNGHANGNGSGSGGGEEEMTVEELLALDPSGGGVEAMHTGGSGGKGSWRRVGRGRREEDAGATLNGDWMQQQHTGGLSYQHSGGQVPGPQQQQHTGGRPLPRRPSGGVHAWEADEGVVGQTVKRVSAVGPGSVPVAGATAVPVVLAQQGSEHDRQRSLQEQQQQQEQERLRREEERQRRAQELADAEARGRARGRRYAEENRALRGLVDAFRVRLEEVERRVGRMEDAAAGTAASVPPASSVQSEAASTKQEQEPRTKQELTLTQLLDPRRLLALFRAAPAQLFGPPPARTRARGQEETEVGPSTIAALPSYVLLVGLGVCAVVLRVLVRRGLGLGVRAGAGGRRG